MVKNLIIKWAIGLNLFLLLILVFSELNAQRRLWTVGTAYTVNNKDLRLAAFQPTAYGLTKSIEVSAHPLVFLAAPNLNIKKQWFRNKKFALASKHGVVSPGFLLQKLADADIYNSLSEEKEIPGILHFKNELLFSYSWGKILCPSFTREEFNRKNTFIGPTKILTLKLGIQNGMQMGDGVMPTLPEKYIFHHTYPYHELMMYYLGLDFDSRLNVYFDYAIDLEYILLEGNHHVFEHKTLINWWVGRKFFHVLAGYQISYGEYPDGWKFFVGPVIDLMWTLRRNKMDLGLFGKKLF
ncbi:MAG: hypothetical protein U9R19_18845 [Bacteroidota bacterium]|nr:hypothetical protein [Bacteroidota bacterium]